MSAEEAGHYVVTIDFPSIAAGLAIAVVSYLLFKRLLKLGVKSRVLLHFLVLIYTFAQRWSGGYLIGLGLILGYKKFRSLMDKKVWESEEPKAEPKAE